MSTPRRERFIDRHIGPSPDEQRRMLDALGLASTAELVDRIVPEAIRTRAQLDLPEPRTEPEAAARLSELADANEVFTSLIGTGYADTITPPVIRRNILENPAWYTAYTPYQPEISQGRLEMLLDFQTMVSDLTAMELANASLLDEGTAAAEAMAMLARVNGDAGSVFLVDADAHPQTIEVVATRAEPLGIDAREWDAGDPVPDGTFGVLVQYPGSSGSLRDLRPVVTRAHEVGALVAVAADLLALTLVVPPGECGADVVVGSSQRFGVPLGFGGPHAAFFATRHEHRRTVPGRLVGVSVDTGGREALRLALQTREQHIRREKATSNICTAQVLLAVVAAAYAIYHGPDGLRAIASRVHDLTRSLASALRTAGLEVTSEHFFDTITVRVPGRAAAIAAAARDEHVNLREVDADTIGISLDETTELATLVAVGRAFGVEGPSDAPGGSTEERAIPETMRRTTPYLEHPVFREHRSETAMLRYLRRLADEDLALDRTMIPLGSCTMKLNATTEMEPISLPGFARLHPFAPLEQAAGYRRLFADLEAWLCEITGFDRVSLQPNAGSQGEFAGLLAIRRFHREQGDDARDVCLIPASAHGTNAASAAMAGMRVVVVACDEDGNVDVEDLKRKADAHAERLAALMVTYPSTHGVFESQIVEVCDLVHDYGGQVYLDGANLNALIGVAKPGEFGADVSHLNLHKTFCIPHGGGGPGVGPIGVRAHLAPHLPGHGLVPEAGPEGGLGAIAAAPWGSAGILPISWAYIALAGGEGLSTATEVALLTANYVARRLGEHYPVLYTGRGGWVAHECILDLRALTRETEVTVEDVAKRLIDFGIHAPTVSFPVAGTLMVEPTESEDLAELDRFCEAMITIRAEIAKVARGEWAVDESPLRHAPHPAEDLLGDWERPYGREQAAHPVATLRSGKYWPPVSRIEGAYGDRHLVCTCPPLEAYEQPESAVEG